MAYLPEPTKAQRTQHAFQTFHILQDDEICKTITPRMRGILEGLTQNLAEYFPEGTPEEISNQAGFLAKFFQLLGVDMLTVGLEMVSVARTIQDRQQHERREEEKALEVMKRRLGGKKKQT